MFNEPLKKASSTLSALLTKVSTAVSGQAKVASELKPTPAKEPELDSLTAQTQERLPAIIPRDQHTISRADISSAALKVLYQLKDAGYQAHLVGGGVRDLLLDKKPKDFDVATDATPEQVQKVFRNCRLIGRRFRLAHVYFGPEIIEVATFRAAQPAYEKKSQSDNGMILRDNIYGSIEEDALRRDFTINALYYNIRDFSVIDYAGGLDDLNVGVLRLMGDPATRYREDPVRMLRAVRFAAKLDFEIETNTEAPIWQLSYLLQDVPPARLMEEVLKLLMAGRAVETYRLLRHYQLFAYLFPQTDALLNMAESSQTEKFLLQGFHNTDQRIARGLPVTPAFLFAILLWQVVKHQAEKFEAEGMPTYPAINHATTEVFSEQVKSVSMPKRFTIMTREIWVLQSRFQHTQGKRPARLLEHPRFRAAYDFLLLRHQAGEADPKLVEWWTAYQEGRTPPPVTTKKKRPPRKRRPRSKAKDRKPVIIDE